MAIDVGPYDQYVLAGVALIGTFAGMLFLMWLSQRSPLASAIHRYRGMAQNFLQVINVIFALNLAFLANDTWGAHERAVAAVFQEAGALRDVVDLADTVGEAGRTAVRAAVADYVRAAADAEWPMLARRQSDPAAGRALDALLGVLAGDADVLVASPTVHAAMLGQAVRVRALRNERITLSRTHVNPLKWLGMAFLGFLTMASIAMVHVDQPRAEVAALVLFATAAAPTAAIILVHGNPFQEPMATSPAPLLALVETLALP
jgi:hypothetical protein